VLAASFCAGGRAAIAAGNDGPPLTLHAGHMVKPDGRLQENAAVVVHRGKIKAVGSADNVQDLSARRFGPKAVICPGLIDLFSTLGAVGQTAETAQVVDPDAAAIDAVDPRDEAFRAALRSGVTAVMVAPAANNLVGGSCACFRTFVDDGRLDVLRDDGPLAFALGEGVWQSERAPTSRAGALHELRTLLTDAQRGQAHPRIRAVVQGKLDAVMVCGSGADVAAVRHGLGNLAGRFRIVHSQDAIDVAADPQGLPRPMVVGPYTFASSRRALQGAAALAESGVEVAFRGGFPEAPPETLRLTAALAVRHGLPPEAARRAMTAAAAQVAGVAGRIGAIAPGKDADLVVFSDDPLRLDAVVLEVYVKGVRVYAAENEAVNPVGERP